MPQKWDDDSFKQTRRDYERKAADPRLLWLATVLLLATMATGIARWRGDLKGEGGPIYSPEHSLLDEYKLPPLHTF